MNLARIILFCLLTTLVHPVFSDDCDALDNEHIPVGTSSNLSEPKIHKLYLHPLQIAITTSGMYCYLYDVWHQVETIQNDAEGIFILASDQWSTTWRCPRCKHENGMLSRSCEKCKYTPPH